MFYRLKKLLRYIFTPWEKEIYRTGIETWTERPCWAFCENYDRKYMREYVVYKYTHKFRKETKLVKKYLN